MNRKIAVILFLSVCVVLAVLLLTKTITSIISGIIFAIALVIFGILSRGFQREKDSTKTENDNAG